jgi:hypothetical protein
MDENEVRIEFELPDLSETINELQQLFSSLPAAKLNAELTKTEFKSWDAEDAAERAEFRNAMKIEVAGAADSYIDAVIIHTRKGTILAVGKRASPTDWDFTEFDGPVRKALKSAITRVEENDA